MRPALPYYPEICGRGLFFILEGFEEVGEFGADVSETFDGAVAAGDAGAVAAYLGFGGFEFEAFVFNEIEDKAQDFDVGGGIEACAARVAPWFDEREFAFPEAQGRRRQPEDVGDFAYLVVFFFYVIHGGVCGCISP